MPVKWTKPKKERAQTPATPSDKPKANKPKGNKPNGKKEAK